MSTAWNWVTNAKTAYSIFEEKVAEVKTIQNSADKANPSVPCPTCTGALSAAQIEQMALFQYGGYLPQNKTANTLVNQLLTPQCVGGANNGKSCIAGCTCEWQLNSTPSNLVVSGEDYVCNVYTPEQTVCGASVTPNPPSFCTP
jgi:hypothetical protein